MVVILFLSISCAVFFSSSHVYLIIPSSGFHTRRFLMLLLFMGTAQRWDREMREPSTLPHKPHPAMQWWAVKVPPLCSQDSSPTLNNIPPVFHLNSFFIDVGGCFEYHPVGTLEAQPHMFLGASLLLVFDLTLSPPPSFHLSSPSHLFQHFSPDKSMNEIKTSEHAHPYTQMLLF